MKLSATDRQVAFAAQLRARESVSSLSRTTGLRAHAVRYALDRLLARGVLKPYAFIDAEKLGYTAYHLLFALSSHQAEVRKRFERTLVNHSNVSAVNRIGGDFHYRMVILARSTKELLQIVDSLVSKFGDIVFDRALVIRCGAWLFPRRYLHPKARAPKPLHVEPADPIAIDRTDARILELLGREETPPLTRLASSLGLPGSTAEYRLKRLETAGIIKGWAYSVDAALFGMLDYRLLVSLRQLDPTTQQQLFTFCSNHHNVYSAARCIGSWDFEVALELESRERITEVVQEIYESLGQAVRSVKSVPIFATVKNTMFPLRANDLLLGDDLRT